MNTRILITVFAASLMFFGVCGASLLGLFWGLANLVNVGETAIAGVEIVALGVSLYLTFHFAMMSIRAEKSLTIESPIEAG